MEAAKSAPQASFWTGDVRDEATIERVVAEAGERLGPIDVVVNAAGVSGIGAAADLDASEWDRVVDINLKGTWLVSKRSLRRSNMVGSSVAV